MSFLTAKNKTQSQKAEKRSTSKPIAKEELEPGCDVKEQDRWPPIANGE